MFLCLKTHIDSCITSTARLDDLLERLSAKYTFKGNKRKEKNGGIFCAHQNWRDEDQSTSCTKLMKINDKHRFVHTVQDLGRNPDQTHMQRGSSTTQSVCHCVESLTWKSLIQCGSKSGSICRNASTSNFCPTRGDQRRILFIYFHFLHVKNKLFTEIFLDLGPLNALFMLACSTFNQNNSFKRVLHVCSASPPHFPLV